MNIYKGQDRGMWLIECDPKFVASAILAIDKLQNAAIAIDQQMATDDNGTKHLVDEYIQLDKSESLGIMEYVLPFMNDLKSCLTEYDD